jgi:hypothetical protein
MFAKLNLTQMEDVVDVQLVEGTNEVPHKNRGVVFREVTLAYDVFVELTASHERKDKVEFVAHLCIRREEKSQMKRQIEIERQR